MTNEQAYVVLENCASLLDSGTRFFTENHTKQFREAYELAMKALRKTERKTGKWIRHDEVRNVYGGTYVECSECGEKYVVQHIEDEKYCRNCGADMRGDSE